MSDWRAVRVPADWRPVAAICRSVFDDSETLTARIVACIEREIPAYGGGDGPEPAEVFETVSANLGMMLLGFAERRGPLPEELEIRGELGRRRAHQGVPVDALIEAYHIGYRELWQALVEEARENHPDANGLLLQAATTVWAWVHEVTSAVANAYEETTRGREVLAMALRQRFVELLLFGDLGSEELDELARSLRFERDEEFRAICIRTSEPAGIATRRLQRVLTNGGGVHECLARGHDVLIISQASPDLDRDIERIAGCYPDAPMGVGLQRKGLQGARLSIGDAERALSLAVRVGGSSRFEWDWFRAMIIGAEERLQPILEKGIRAARSNPQLAETIVAFAGADFSITGAARKLGVHPNSAVYRLDRWRQLTGWDPRTYSGLTVSLASLEFRSTPL